jgi:hypothetical protein
MSAKSAKIVRVKVSLDSYSRETIGPDTLRLLDEYVYLTDKPVKYHKAWALNMLAGLPHTDKEDKPFYLTEASYTPGRCNTLTMLNDMTTCYERDDTTVSFYATPLMILIDRYYTLSKEDYSDCATMVKLGNRGVVKAIEWALDKGADPNAPSMQMTLKRRGNGKIKSTENSPRYPIELAIECGSYQVVELLLKYGARLDFTPERLTQTLVDSIIRGLSSKCIDLVLRLGVEVDAMVMQTLVDEAPDRDGHSINDRHVDEYDRTWQCMFSHDPASMDIPVYVASTWLPGTKGAVKFGLTVKKELEQFDYDRSRTLVQQAFGLCGFRPNKCPGQYDVVETILAYKCVGRACDARDDVDYIATGCGFGM